jgi:O-antigen/teichoic acid export membrane protein
VSTLLTRFRTAKRLRDDFAWMLAGNVIYSACQWGIVIALAKLGTAKQVGEYALGVAVSAPIAVFANLQLRALVASETRDRFTFGHYLAFRLASLGAALAVITGVARYSQPDWSLRAIVILTGFAQALEALSETYYGFMQKCGRMDRVSISLLLRGPFPLAALCATMYRTHSVILAVVALLMARFVILFAWDMRLGFAQAALGPTQAAAATRVRWDASSMFSLLRLALPLGVIVMLLSLNSNFPRYFLEAHAGSAELGIFSALASLLTAGNLVVSAFGQSVFQPIARACADKDRAKFRAYSLVALLLGSGVGLAFVVAASLFGRTILGHVFRPEYAEHTGALVRLTFAGTVLFVGSSLGYVITGARRLGPQIPVLVLSGLASAAVSAWSIPLNGLNGAADAMLAAGLVQLAGISRILWRVDRDLGVCPPSNRQPLSEEPSSAVAVC